MKLTHEQIHDLSQYSFIRMDGAWFLGVAKKYGIDAAWELDKEAWKQFSYLFGKRVRADHIPDPVWPESFIDAVDILSTLFKIKDRSVVLENNSVVIRATDCETQKAIAKAGVADCGIVTVETYKNLVKGLFSGGIEIDVAHTKNLNQGADCCEVIITKK